MALLGGSDSQYIFRSEPLDTCIVAYIWCKHVLDLLAADAVSRKRMALEQHADGLPILVAKFMRGLNDEQALLCRQRVDELEFCIGQTAAGPLDDRLGRRFAT